MSSIKLESNASGTGVFTIASPNSNTNRTLTLPDATGTIITTAGGAAISGTTGTFTGLVDISAAGAGQIKFPATANASGDANTLDDYEEGTWTPNDGSGAGLTLTINGTSTYIKIGRMVTVCCSVTYPSTANGTTMSIGGLPFTVADIGNNQGGPIGNTNLGTAVTLLVLGNTTRVGVTSFSDVNQTNANFSTKTFRFSATYITT